MKSIIILAVCVVAAVAAPATSFTSDKDAQVLKYVAENTGVDGYNYEVSLSNGIAQQEQGVLKNIGTENEALEVRGQYSYPGPDGVIYTVIYIANEDGFQAKGDHIPKAP